MPKISRVSIKNKWYVVIRNDRGQFIDRRKWSRKFNLHVAASKFRRDNALKENISKRKLISRPEFTEITDTSKKPKIKKDLPFRVVVTGLLKDGTVISASSQARRWESFHDARESAETNFWERVAQHFNQDYDAETGQAFDNQIKSMDSITIMVV